MTAVPKSKSESNARIFTSVKSAGIPPNRPIARSRGPIPGELSQNWRAATGVPTARLPPSRASFSRCGCHRRCDGRDGHVDFPFLRCLLRVANVIAWVMDLLSRLSAVVEPSDPLTTAESRERSAMTQEKSRSRL